MHVFKSVGVSVALMIKDGDKMQSEQAIGVFDSGVGGLSVLRHIRERLPNENLIYIADSAFMPYGCKSNQVVGERCMTIAAFFSEYPCKAMVVACNTATAVSIQHLRTVYPFPIIGMEPAVKPAIGRSRTGVVGVLVTSGTADSDKFKNLKQRFSEDAVLMIQPCPGLVEQIEKGEVDSQGTRCMLQAFLYPLIQQGIDTLVLGCTHYPFVMALIREIVGEHVSIIDAGPAIVRELERKLLFHQLLLAPYDVKKTASVLFYSSGDIDRVEPLMSQLWGEGVSLKRFLL